MKRTEHLYEQIMLRMDMTRDPWGRRTSGNNPVCAGAGIGGRVYSPSG